MKPPRQLTRDLVAYVLVVALILVPAYLILERRANDIDRHEHATRAALQRVCRSVNHNGHNLTIEHRKTKAFLLLAYRARIASARADTNPTQRRIDRHAAQLYLNVADSYKRFTIIRCRIP